MDCEEFLRQFRDALDGKVSEGIIQDNVDYYRSYISGQTAGGKSEPEVLGMLGDPRLLAKTIEESSKFASEGRDTQDGYAGDYGSQGYYGSARSESDAYAENTREKHFRLPGWLITGIVMVVVVFLVVFMFRVAVFLAPVIMAVVVLGFLFRAVKSWWQER